jgi:hypothetical protein
MNLQIFRDFATGINFIIIPALKDGPIENGIKI